SFASERLVALRLYELRADREIAEERPSPLMLHEQLDSRLADPGLPHRVVRCHWGAITDSPTLSSQHERVARGASCQPAPSDRVDLEWNTRLKPALIDADWKWTL